MRMRPYQGFCGNASRRRMDDCQNERPAPEPRVYTPQQQLAALILRRSELSKAVVAKLYHSTVRASADDFEFLVTERLANRKGIGHELTPMGRYKADEFARALGKQFEIPILTTGGAMQPRGSYQRKWHTQSWTQ